MNFLLFYGILLVLPIATGLTCYCDYCRREGYGQTCEGLEVYCYSSVEYEYDKNSKTLNEVRAYGCLHNHASAVIQCKEYRRPNGFSTKLECCNDSDFCNEKLTPTVKKPAVERKLFQKLQQMSKKRKNRGRKKNETEENRYVHAGVLAIVGAFFGGVVFSTLGIFAVKHLKRVRKKSSEQKKDLFELEDQTTVEESSGSGAGEFRAVVPTISKNLALLKIIGQGRFGRVFKAQLKGQLVAVKIFSTMDEYSWWKEKDIYEHITSNENILGFIAADIRSSDAYTEMLLVTQYHKLGSLYDYININTVDLTQLVRMSDSIISGLCYLHMEIFGQTMKPVIAHRDIKSKNILVKNRNGDCCIADFGLAAKCCEKTDVKGENRDVQGEINYCEEFNAKVGTKRYMAPEELNDTINTQWYPSLKCADIYSFGLVLWELCNRSTYYVNEKLIQPNEYQLPYFEHVSMDPSFEDMHEVVCAKNVRPVILENWNQDLTLRHLSKIISECWFANPEARLSALRIKKSIAELLPPETSV